MRSRSRRRCTAALAASGLLLSGLAAVSALPWAGAVAGAAEAATTGGSTCAGSAPAVAPPSGHWTCTLDDEFNGTSLDTTTWTPELTTANGYKTGPPGSAVCYENDPRTISESGGYLSLSVVALTKAFSCKKFYTKYIGGMVDSMGLFQQEFGYFQVRAELPAQTTPGVQETLWLYPANASLYGPWPDSGEIDFGEFYSKYPNNDVPVLHFPGSKQDPNATNNYCTQAGVATAGQFNTYAVMWTPTTITAYFNGVPCFTDNYWGHVTYPDKAPAPFNQPFYMSLTQALGNGSGNTFSASTSTLPATTKIDWARAWQYG